MDLGDFWRDSVGSLKLFLICFMKYWLLKDFDWELMGTPGRCRTLLQGVGVSASPCVSLLHLPSMYTPTGARFCISLHLPSMYTPTGARRFPPSGTVSPEIPNRLFVILLDEFSPPLKMWSGCLGECACDRSHSKLPTPLCLQAQNVVLCDIEQELKEKMKKFRMRKETNNAALISEHHQRRLLFNSEKQLTLACF